MKKNLKLHWQRDAGTGRFARIRLGTEAYIAYSESDGINSWETLTVFMNRKAFLSANSRVCTLPFKGSEPKPLGKTCVTFIADKYTYLVDESNLLFV